jgi:hypothetical protein
MVGIPSGEYHAFVSHDGFASFRIQVHVKPDTVTFLDLWLHRILSRTDSTDVVRLGKSGVDYKMKYFRPDVDSYR